MTGTEPAAAEGAASVPARPRWWVYVLVAVGIAALAFAIGRFSTFGSAGSAAAGPNAADIGFARDMQVHHTQAIEMAMEIYRKTEDDDVRRMSYDIATTPGGSARRDVRLDRPVGPSAVGRPAHVMDDGCRRPRRSRSHG